MNNGFQLVLAIVPAEEFVGTANKIHYKIKYMNDRTETYSTTTECSGSP